MLIQIEGLLDQDTVAAFRQRLAGAAWRDGRDSAGNLAMQVKQNQQLAEDDPVARELAQQITQRLSRNATFTSAALPRRIYPPRFNRYVGGGQYGAHIDGAIMQLPGNREYLRSDISATLFLCNPDEYDGGELVMDTRYGRQTVKLPAGNLVLYPSTTLHRVNPVTRGERICSFFWLQSFVASEEDRGLLFELDQSVRALRAQPAPEAGPAILQLTGIYHNLLRRWTDL